MPRSTRLLQALAAAALLVLCAPQQAASLSEETCAGDCGCTGSDAGGSLAPRESAAASPLVSDRIRQRVETAAAPYFSNDNIADFILPGELEELQEELEERIDALLRTLVIDVDNDHNTQDTPRRVARMMLTEVFKGRYTPRPQIQSFPNFRQLRDIYTVGPITVRSACAHHLVPIYGQAFVGLDLSASGGADNRPEASLLGLSKFSRIADWVFSRPQIQEEAVVMFADEIEALAQPRGLGIILKTEHFCMKWRGVKESSTTMVNRVLRGTFQEEAVQKAFFDMVRQQSD